MTDTVFLMLVHDQGVSHPEIWEQYLSRPESARTALRVHVDLKVTRDQLASFPQFVADHMLTTRVRVDWGNANMVDATIQSMEEVLRVFPDVKHIVLCSGYDVPLRFAADFLQRHTGKTVYFSMHSPGDTANIVRATIAGTPSLTLGQRAILDKLVFHHQWLTVSKQHAAVLVANRISLLQSFAPVHAALQPSIELSPDEWYVITGIRLYAELCQNSNTLVEHVVCGVYNNADSPDHPVTFTKVSKPERLLLEELYGDKIQVTSLVDILGQTYDAKHTAAGTLRRTDPTALTLRKVRIQEADVFSKMISGMWAKPPSDPRAQTSQAL
jgi:hypothetical protein